MNMDSVTFRSSAPWSPRAPAALLRRYLALTIHRFAPQQHAAIGREWLDLNERTRQHEAFRWNHHAGKNRMFRSLRVRRKHARLRRTSVLKLSRGKNDGEGVTGKKGQAQSNPFANKKTARSTPHLDSVVTESKQALVTLGTLRASTWGARTSRHGRSPSPPSKVT